MRRRCCAVEQDSVTVHSIELVHCHRLPRSTERPGQQVHFLFLTISQFSAIIRPHDGPSSQAYRRSGCALPSRARNRPSGARGLRRCCWLRARPSTVAPTRYARRAGQTGIRRRSVAFSPPNFRVHGVVRSNSDPGSPAAAKAGARSHPARQPANAMPQHRRTRPASSYTPPSARCAKIGHEPGTPIRTRDPCLACLASNGGRAWPEPAVRFHHSLG
jgi:hypothetical protein